MKRRRPPPARPFFLGGTHGSSDETGDVVTEYFISPSVAAAQLFNHVIAIGKSRIQPGAASIGGDLRVGYLIHFVKRGGLWHRIRGREFHLREGGVRLLDRSQRTDQGNDLRRVTELWWVLFHGRETPRLFEALGADRDPAFPGVARHRFESIFDELWRIVRRKPLDHEVRAHVLLTAMLGELFSARARQHGTAMTDIPRPVPSKRTQDAMAFMGFWFRSKLGIKGIAHDLGVSPGHFFRSFHRETGMTPIAYLNSIRIQHARRLLSTTDTPVAQVGALVGIDDSKYFSRLFRKLVGVSPAAYRANPRSPAE